MFIFQPRWGYLYIWYFYYIVIWGGKIKWDLYNKVKR